jgi:transcriptional antiterminator RfaH
MLQWFVLHCKAHKERVVDVQLRSQGYESYCPVLRVQPVNPRARTLVPYFPGYLFVRVDPRDTPLSLFQWMPFTLGLVRFGGEAATVAGEFVVALSELLEQANRSARRPAVNFRPGDELMVTRGPFAGYEALFDRQLKGSDRVRVLLKMLNDRYVTTTLHADALSAASNR